MYATDFAEKENVTSNPVFGPPARPARPSPAVEPSSSSAPAAPRTGAAGIAQAASSSSAALHPDLPRPAAAAGSPEDPLEHADPPPNHPEPPAVPRKKQVREDVIYINYKGLCYGSLRFNSRAKTITAHCEIEGHGKCRKERTVAPTEKGLAQGKSGRPIGFLVHWLLGGPSFQTALRHIHSERLADPTFADRRKARDVFMKLEGAVAFSRASERQDGEDVAHEPDVSR